ncbi:hypothetical protein MCUN1_001117 [Malassezia cuniculi]|uniref:Large ribosomal subunit protein uL30m n=1 Tax=Malassezia cuniculi TaxID=948313 RepID=A0AAF0ESA5_9BASI|nr:hypothetical protein MCUN1_001117 [Malassezia cuniculi]
MSKLFQRLLRSVPARGYSTAAAGETTHYRVTLRRSAIGLPERKSRILEALGLHKRLQSVYQAHSQTAAGNILAVKELVHVENVRLLQDSNEGKIWVNAKGEVVDAGRRMLKAPRGYKIVGNVLDVERDRALRAQSA